MTCAIIQLVFGIVLLYEVCRRILKWTYASDFTYEICRPLWGIFGSHITMKKGVIITFLETIVGAVLTYRGIMELL